MADIQQIRVRDSGRFRAALCQCSLYHAYSQRFLLDFVTMLPGLTNPKGEHAPVALTAGNEIGSTRSERKC